MAIVGVGWNGSAQEIDEFITRHGLSFTNVHDTDGSIFSSFGVAGQPAWVFQSADGDRELVLGAMGDDELAQNLATLSAPG